MAAWKTIFRRAAVSGTAASVTSFAALALLARAEGKGALQPINSTSHWLNGKHAGSFKGADLAHTAVGYATHHAATVFWAVFFEQWIAARRPLAGLPMLRDALALSVVAVAVDYVATPKRFTPGWEFVLSKRSIAAAYVAMSVGLAAGARIWPNGGQESVRGSILDPGRRKCRALRPRRQARRHSADDP